jgi:hypothetical protein
MIFPRFMLAGPKKKSCTSWGISSSAMLHRSPTTLYNIGFKLRFVKVETPVDTVRANIR